MAYLEFIQGEDGKRKRIGPMGEKEEMGAKDTWQVGAPTRSLKPTLTACGPFASRRRREM